MKARKVLRCTIQCAPQRSDKLLLVVLRHIAFPSSVRLYRAKRLAEWHWVLILRLSEARPGIEPTDFRSESRRFNHYAIGAVQVRKSIMILVTFAFAQIFRKSLKKGHHLWLYSLNTGCKKKPMNFWNLSFWLHSQRTVMSDTLLER